MKFLIRGKCLALALRLLDEGNQVRLSDPFSKTTGQGIVELTDFDKGVQWADLVVFDINDGKLPQEAEQLRNRRIKVVGSSAIAGKLENDRPFGADIARQAGIEVRPFTLFKGADAFRTARQFLSEKPEKTDWVWKSNNSSPADPPTYVGSSGLSHFLRMLSHYEQFYKEQQRTPSFVLMPKVDGLAEVSTEGWFNGKQFFLPNHTIEKNRLFNDDLGPKTGCSGCVVWSAPDSKLYHKLIPPLAQALAGKYCGPVDINAMIEKDSNQPIFLEFTTRFGYDAIYALLELLDGELGSLLDSLASGTVFQGRLRAGLAATVRLYIPPYPEDGKSEAEAQGVPIAGFDPSRYDKHISPCDVMVDGEGEVVAASPGGQLFAISDTGSTVDSAYEKAYSHIKKLDIPQVGYRTDLPQAIGKVYDSLLRTGWVSDLGSKHKLTFKEMLSNGRQRNANYR